MGFMNGTDVLIPVIVGFGVNGWNVYRSLKKGGVAPIVVDDDPGSIFWSSKNIALFHCPHLSGAELIDSIRSLAMPGRQYVIISATEDAVRTLSQRRAELPPNVQLPYPDHAIVDMLLDKRKFYEVARAGGFRISNMHFVESWSEVPSGGKIAFPCILKARTKIYASGLAKAYRLNSLDALGQTLLELSEIEGIGPADFVVQEWVPGSDSDVLFCMQYYNARSEPVISFVGRKIRQWRPQTGGTASAEPVKNDEVLRETTRFFQSVGMRGICSMEFKLSSADGRLYMIEPTACRADYQEGVAVANGCNIPLAAYLDAAGKPLHHCVEPIQRPVKWVNVGHDYYSAAYYIQRGELSWREWMHSLRGPKSYAIYTPEDPGPFLALLRRHIEQRVKQAIGWK